MHFVPHQLWGIGQVIYLHCWQGCMQTTGAHSPPGPRRTVVSRALETYKGSAPEKQMLSIGGASSDQWKKGTGNGRYLGGQLEGETGKEKFCWVFPSTSNSW